jgi:hypothetical protein
VPRVFQHDSWLFALADELWDELAHALVAPDEHRGVVVVADPRIVHHVLQVADDFGAAQIMASGRNQGLVLMQGAGKGGFDRAEVYGA